MNHTNQEKLDLLKEAAIAADAVVKSHTPSSALNATPEQMKSAKAYMIRAVPGLVMSMFDEIERLTTELEAARIDQEIAQFARDTTINPGLAEALDPILDPVVDQLDDEPATTEEWYATMKLMLDAAKASGLWPVKPEPELTEEAQADRAEFEAYKDEYGGCSCHIAPPCGHCTHPGNPTNQEDPSCWKVQP